MEKKLSFSEVYHGDRSGSGGHYVYGKHQRCYASATERK